MDQSAERWYLTGLNLLGSGRYKEALEAFIQAIDIDDAADSWVGAGQVFKAAGQPKEALRAFDEALRAEPDWARAWWWKGITLAELGDVEGAVAAYDRALAGRFGEDFKRFKDVLMSEREDLRRQLAGES
jgi:tetratricopeptide (TPR) repeat protein